MGEPRPLLVKLPLAAAVLLPSAYKFAQRFAPALPYEVRYMIHNKGITNQQISGDILPVLVYSRVLFILLAAPACALFSYHSILVITSFFILVEYSLLLCGKTIFTLQLMQLFRAIAASAEVVFPSYLLFLAPPDKFQILISYTDASSSISHFGASELGQALVAEGFSIRLLLYISMAMVMLSIVICSVLPKDPQRDRCLLASDSKKPPLSSFISVCRLKGSLGTVKETWRDPLVQLLSFWWTFDVALYAMAATYMLNLFEEIDSTSMYSGHVVAATEVTNFFGALCAIPLSRLVSRSGGMALYASGSILIGILLISMPYMGALWFTYLGYILLTGVNRALLCLVQVQCARNLANQEYVLLFSLNTLAGRLIQTALQAGIEVIAVSIFHQYYVFGSLFLVVALVFCILYVYRLWTVKDTEDKNYHPLLDEEQPLLN